MALRAALMIDAEPVARGRAASGAKAKIGKCARFVAEQSVQLHGANGLTENYPVSRFLRDAKVMEIIEGSTQIQQIAIVNSPPSEI